MKIFVCGNINSGKSHWISMLSNLYPDFRIIQIDEWRKRYSDGTMEGELVAWRKFIDDILSTENAFVEFCSTGQPAESLAKKIVAKSFVVLYVKECVEICLDRLASKPFSFIPYPTSDEKIEDLIIRIDKRLKANKLYALWEDKALSILEIDKKSVVADIISWISHWKNEYSINTFIKKGADI